MSCSSNLHTKTPSVLTYHTLLQLGKNYIQPPGLRALLEVVQSHPSCGLHLLDLHSITISLDVHKMIDRLKRSHVHLRVEHGGVGGYKSPKPLLSPLAKLQEYCKRSDIKMEDLWLLFDKDGKKMLSEVEFKNALRVSTLSGWVSERESLRACKAWFRQAKM